VLYVTLDTSTCRFGKTQYATLDTRTCRFGKTQYANILFFNNNIFYAFSMTFYLNALLDKRNIRFKYVTHVH
jgi:hypothetical protein